MMNEESWIPQENQERILGMMSGDEEMATLLRTDPASFLHNFGYRLDAAVLRRELASVCEGHAEIEFEVRRLEIRKKQLERKKRGTDPQVRVQNRRYNGLRKMMTEEDSYFSADRMEERDPLLYHRQVGRFLTRESRSERALSQVLLEDFAGTELMRRRLRQRGAEIGIELLEETDYQAMKEKEEESDDDALVENRSMEIDEMDERREDFLETMTYRFLSGKDSDFFDYSKVDDSEQFDDLEEETRSAEDDYFDEQTSV